MDFAVVSPSPYIHSVEKMRLEFDTVDKLIQVEVRILRNKIFVAQSKILTITRNNLPTVEFDIFLKLLRATQNSPLRPHKFH